MMRFGTGSGRTLAVAALQRRDMKVIQTTGTTDENGMLTLPLGQPLTSYEVVVVLNPMKPAKSIEESWAAINAIRVRQNFHR
jgi:hypothetical protein